MKTSLILLLYSKHDLCNNKHLLDDVKTPGYNFVYINREQKHIGGVGGYLKEELDIKINKNLKRLGTTTEQLWLAIKGKCKKTSILPEKFNQHRPQMKKKSCTCEGGAHFRISVLTFIDELEKQLLIKKKTVEVDQ